MNNSQIQSTDLIIEILMKLPPKSIAKLMVVSKLWYCIIRSKYFTDRYLTRSLTRPCCLFTFNRDHTQFFHSQSSSGHHISTTSLPPNPLNDVSPPVRGLICCQNSSKVAISNPSTGQIVDLTNFKIGRRVSSFLGYDSIRDEYKVLLLQTATYTCGPAMADEYQVFTLGGQKKKEATWRMIECKVPHCPVTKGQCNDGVVYYGARSNTCGKVSLIVCFDVRLEEFTMVKSPVGFEINLLHQSELVKYQKKIALVNHSFSGNVELWVLEDVEKQEWSKIFVVVPCWEDLVGENLFYFRGVISSGEFIFAPLTYPCQLYMISYDDKEKNARRVEIEGIGSRFDSMIVFLDHVESPMFL